MDVHEEPVPKRLQKMKDKSLLAIEKTEKEKIAIDPVEKGANIKWHRVPAPLEPSGALVGIAKKVGAQLPCRWVLTAVQFFAGVKRSVVIVLADPKRNVRLFPVVFNEIVFKVEGSAIDVKVMIQKVVFVETDGGTPKEFQEIFWVIPAVLDPVSAKNLAAFDEQAGNAIQEFRMGRKAVCEFGGKFRRDALVGIEPKNPFVLQRQIFKRPRPLLGMGLEWMGNNLCAKAGSDRKRGISAAGIYDKEFANPTRQT